MTTLTAPAVSPEVVTPIKPSEALRLGRLTRPVRLLGELWQGTDAACAVGAILEGMGESDASYRTLELRWPEFLRHFECPVGSDSDGYFCSDVGPLSSGIWHLNDAHDWSDDQIVAWLKSLGL